MAVKAESKFWADNLAYGSATILSGILNWLYAILLAHGMGPARYGVVVTLNNVVAVVTLPASVVTLAATRRGKPCRKLLRIRIWYGAAGTLLWVVMAIFSTFLSSAFKISPSLFLIFGLATWPIIDYAANLGYLARARQYLWLGILTVAGSALSVGAVLGAVQWPEPVAALGLLQALALWILWATSARAVKRVPVESAPNPQSIALSAGVGIAQSVMTLMDGVVAKARLRPVQAGYYNGLATVGQSLPFAAASLALVMLTAMLDRPQQRTKWLHWTLAIYLGLGFGIEGLFWRMPKTIVDWALGGRFNTVSHWLVLYGLGMLALGLLMIYLAEAIARGWWELLMLVIGGLALWMLLLIHAHGFPGLVHATALSLIAVSFAVLATRTWLNWHNG